MVGESFEVSLWFNSKTKVMCNRLENSSRNSGVGINFGKLNLKYFNPKKEYVKLQFDNGSTGHAKVKKKSWQKCPHLIQKCIGSWARKNGIWRKRLTQKRVPFNMKVIEDFEIYYVYK